MHTPTRDQIEPLLREYAPDSPTRHMDMRSDDGHEKARKLIEGARAAGLWDEVERVLGDLLRHGRSEEVQLALNHLTPAELVAHGIVTRREDDLDDDTRGGLRAAKARCVFAGALPYDPAMRGEYKSAGGFSFYRNYARYDRAWYLDNLRTFYGDSPEAAAGVGYIARSLSDDERGALYDDLRERGKSDPWYAAVLMHL